MLITSGADKKCSAYNRGSLEIGGVERALRAVSQGASEIGRMWKEGSKMLLKSSSVDQDNTIANAGTEYTNPERRGEAVCWSRALLRRRRG